MLIYSFNVVHSYLFYSLVHPFNLLLYIDYVFKDCFTDTNQSVVLPSPDLRSIKGTWVSQKFGCFLFGIENGSEGPGTYRILGPSGWQTNRRRGF